MLALLPGLRRYSRSLTRSDAEGEDLLQDCVERALAKRGSWHGVNLKGWLYAIMTNLHRSAYRRGLSQRAISIDDAPDIADGGIPSDPLARGRLAAAIAGLPAEHRVVLMLVVVEGMSYQDVADMLDIPLGTVMSRLSRARRRLRDVLAARNVIPLRRQT